MRIASALALALLAFPPTSFAQYGGAIYVSPARNLAWWIADKELRPSGTTIGRHTLKAVNAARDKPDMGGGFCQIEQVRPAMFRSIDRTTQKEIAETFSTRPPHFEQRFQPIGGPKLHAQVGIYETCDAVPNTGFFLLVSREDTNEIVLLEEWQHGGGEAFMMHIYPVEQGKIGRSSCLLCGDTSVLHYDVLRQKLYWEYTGH